MSKTILFLDDDGFMSVLIDEVLRNQGYSVLLAYNTNTAFTMMKESKVDVAIIDINLKNSLNGIDFVDLFLKRFKVPVFFYTNGATEEEIKKINKVTNFGYVLKNGNSNELIQRIEECINRS